MKGDRKMSKVKFVLLLIVFAVLSWGITMTGTKQAASAETQVSNTQQDSSATVQSGGVQTEADAAAVQAIEKRNAAIQRRRDAQQLIKDTQNAQQSQTTTQPVPVAPGSGQ
jgi:TolA-binding protein